MVYSTHWLVSWWCFLHFSRHSVLSALVIMNEPSSSSKAIHGRRFERLGGDWQADWFQSSGWASSKETRRQKRTKSTMRSFTQQKIWAETKISLLSHKVHTPSIGFNSEAWHFMALHKLHWKQWSHRLGKLPAPMRACIESWVQSTMGAFLLYDFHMNRTWYWHAFCLTWCFPVCHRLKMVDWHPFKTGR